MAEETLHNDVAAPKGALIGDENLASYDPEVRKVNQQVDAQVTGPPAEVVDKVRVSETVVKLDNVILDPSSPEAVQIPDAGRGPLDLPIHRLAQAPSPEKVFAGEQDADNVVDKSVLDES